MRKKMFSIKKVMTVFILVFFIFCFISFSSPDKEEIWGDRPNEAYIAIKGKKPSDAMVRLWVDFWVTGEKCESYSYDMFGRKAHKGGKITGEYSHNFSDKPDHYELRFPYQNKEGNNNCIVIFRNAKIETYNNSSPASFASLRFTNVNLNKNEKITPMSTVIEANNCNSYNSKISDKVWVICKYSNGVKLRKQREEPYSLRYDFSELLYHPDTYIEFNIYAGEHYNSDPLLIE